MRLTVEPELALAAEATLAECPSWDPETGQLIWIDIFGQSVHRWDPATGHDRVIDVGRDIGAAALSGDGTIICAVRGQVLRVDGSTGQMSQLAWLEPGLPGNRPNDGKVDREGRLWIGTMADDARVGAGGLYRLDTDGSLHRVLGDLTIANGLDWSPDGSRMYLIDSATRRIDVFDFESETGALSGRRPFAEVPAGPGLPDGMCVDADGGVWVALWDGWSVLHYAFDGRLLDRYAFPVSHVTSVCFGGDTLQDLYVTTAWVDSDGARRSPEQKQWEPEAGSIFRLRVGATGQHPNMFGRPAG